MNQSNEFKLILKYVKKHGKVPMTKYPIALERRYALIIHDIIGKFLQSVKTAHREDDAESYRKRLEEKLLLLYNDPQTRDKISDICSQIIEFNHKQFVRQISAYTGIDWQEQMDWRQVVEDDWVSINYELLQNTTHDYLNKILSAYLLFAAGKTPISEFEAGINKLTKGLVTRSKRIARDQVGNLNSSVWKQQYQNIGVNYYFWHTQLDERVRGNPAGIYPKYIPSHWAMEGLLCNWNDASVYSDDGGKTWKKKNAIMEPLQVGMAIACRCVPFPYLEVV